MRKVLLGSFLLMLAVAAGAWQAPVHAAPMGGLTSLGRDAAAERNVTEAGYYHRRRRHFGFGFYGPHFSFYVGPRYRHRYRYRPYYYYGGPRRYYRSYRYYRPYRYHRRHHRHWRYRRW